jgi:hypothetical protein
LLELQHASAHVVWPQADYTLPEHDQDEEQVAYQLQVHYRISYTLQVQQVPLGPPTAEQSVEQLLDSVPAAVQETAWRDVLTLEEPPTQPQRVSCAPPVIHPNITLRFWSVAASADPPADPKPAVCD